MTTTTLSHNHNQHTLTIHVPLARNPGETSRVQLVHSSSQRNKATNYVLFPHWRRSCFPPTVAMTFLHPCPWNSEIARSNRKGIFLNHFGNLRINMSITTAQEFQIRNLPATFHLQIWTAVGQHCSHPQKRSNSTSPLKLWSMTVLSDSLPKKKPLVGPQNKDTV